jgi:phage head maturation protease
MFGVAKRGDEWEEKPDGLIIRYVRKIEKVYEFGPVTMPAYTQTTTDAVAKRSFDSFIEQKQKEESEHRSQWAQLRLQMLGK